MDDDNELDPLARLRAADPAAGVEPRAGFAEAVVARATEPQAGGATTAPLADLATARARRGRIWRPLVAVAATVAIFGGAGIAIGQHSGGSIVAAAPPISLHGGTSSGGAETAPRIGAQGGKAVAGSSAADRAFGYGFGRNSFTASGLSTSTGTAAAYAFDPRSASDARTVGALATALGLRQTPAQKDGSWTVGPQDGTAPSLTVGLDGTLSFSYYDPSFMASCSKTEAGVTPEPCTPSRPLPSTDAAIAALRALIANAGRDADTFQYEANAQEGALTQQAQAWPVVDGQRVDQPWSIELTADGVVSASGFLAPIVSVGDYPVVSAQQAFERLSDPRFGAQRSGMPIALRAQGAGSVAGSGAAIDTAPPSAAPPTEPPATPTAGTPLSWPVNRVHIVSARLGLASQWQPDGGVLIVPAYEFTDSDGGTWSVVAVADDKLDFSVK